MTTEESTSKSLLAGLRDRDPIAWARVFEVYGPSIQLWCRKSRLPDAEVEEAVQRVLLTVIDKAADYRRRHPDRSFRKWLWRVTRSRLSDMYREAFRHQIIDPVQLDSLLAEDGLASGCPPEDGLTLSDSLARAMALVQKHANPVHWEIFMRSVRSEGSNAIIATDFETTSVNVRQIKRRMLAQIHGILELMDDEDA